MLTSIMYSLEKKKKKKVSLSCILYHLSYEIIQNFTNTKIGRQANITRAGDKFPDASTDFFLHYVFSNANINTTKNTYKILFNEQYYLMNPKTNERKKK